MTSSTPPPSPPAPSASPSPPAPQVRTARARIAGRLPRQTPRVFLRELAPEDVGAVHAYRSLPEVTRYLGHPPLDLAGTADLVDRWLSDPAGLSVVLERDGELVGDVRLGFRPSSAMAPATTEEVDAGLGYALHPAHQGHGLASEAVRELVGLVLGPGDVRRITARVFAPARASSALLRRIGFRLDGVDRAAVRSPDDDSWWDDECWSLLREDP